MQMILEITFVKKETFVLFICNKMTKKYEAHTKLKRDLIKIKFIEAARNQIKLNKQYI